jgi:hypothetical protein
LSLGALGVGLALLLAMASACLSSVDQGEWRRGNVLQINLSNVQRVPEVAYAEGGKNYVIRSRTPGGSLVVAKVLLRNDRSAQVSLLVNREAAYLTDRQLNRHGLVDPYTQREALDQPPPAPGKFFPFLWGVVNVPQGYQVEGWLLFEIPEAFKAYEFNWEQADSIRVSVEGSL